MVRDALKTVRVKTVTTLAGQVDSNIVPERLVATLSEYFAALAAVLAGIGLYGLLAYTVAPRTSEIGVRMALGATANGVSRLVLADAMRMVGTGLLAGMGVALWGKPLDASIFHDLKFESPAPLVIGGGAVVVIALLASYLPARRAACVDPIVAVRHE
ncbi:MAG: FtsX-like permease family protein [Bryobacteraceae bacterium]